MSRYVLVLLALGVVCGCEKAPKKPRKTVIHHTTPQALPGRSIT